MSEPTDDLRQIVAHAIAAQCVPPDRQCRSDTIPCGDTWCACLQAGLVAADAAIAAYRAHPDGAAKDWLAGRDAAAKVAELEGDTWSRTMSKESYDLEAAANDRAAAIQSIILALQPPTL